MLPPAKKQELPLVIWPDNRLAQPVGPWPEENLGAKLVRNTAGAMIRAMYKHYGVGLAAQQVGVPFQIFVMDAYWTQPDKSKHPQVFLNPRITDVGKYATNLPHPGEGCLSFPYDHHAIVERHDQIELEWLDFKGEIHHQWFDGYEAIVIQHEFDHLLGKCYIDCIGPLRRDMAIRRARKMRRHYRNGMKKGLKAMKQLGQSKEALAVRNREFEAYMRNIQILEDAEDITMIEERMKDPILLSVEETENFLKEMENAPPASVELTDATKRYKEAITDGTLETDIPSGDSEEPTPRPSSRFTEASRRLVQREDARRDRKRMQLSVSDQDQEGDERTETSGVSK
jgi:peptide deformylase